MDPELITEQVDTGMVPVAAVDMTQRLVEPATLAP
jgi:hypothetical protein